MAAMASLSVQVSQFSRILPQFRVSLPFNRLHSLSLSSSPSPFSISQKSFNEHLFVVSYLINKFGWSSKLANSKAKYLKFNATETPERVLNFFKKHGFSDTQISLLVKRYPKLLLVNPENTLLPMFEFLSSLGFSSTEIIGVVTKAPQILEMSLEKIVVPAFNLLCNLVNSNDEAVKVVKRDPVILTHYPEVDNIQSLLEAGVPAANIVAFMSYPYTPTSDNLRKMVKEVKETVKGFDSYTMKLLLELRTIKLLSTSTWEDKLQVLKKYGWSDCEVLLALEKHPKLMITSKEKIEGIMDFLVNTMGIEATTAAKSPYIFLKSFDKRIVPRCLVYLFMLEKGLCERTLSVYTFCSFSETRFLTRFIKPYENEAPELQNLYKSIMRLHSLPLSFTPSTPSVSENSSNKHSFEVSYLINAFGWSPKDAISKAKFLRFKATEKTERVLAFLKKHEFTKTQISHVIRKRPQFLLSDPETRFLPKLEFLSSLGLSRTEVTDVVTKATDILTVSLEKKAIPSFSLIRNLVNSDEEAVKIVKRHPTILLKYPEVDNIKILLEIGVPVANILVFMSLQQKGFTPTPPDIFRNTVEEVKEMGFDPCTMKFLYVIWAIKLLGKSTWVDKAQVFKKYGWSDHEFMLALEKYPSFIGGISKDKIDRVMNFLVNTVGIGATDVASFPNILDLSFEKRIFPRGLVYKSVLEKGLCKRKFSICTVLRYSEARFLSKFIKPYENEAPELWDLYKNPFAAT